MPEYGILEKDTHWSFLSRRIWNNFVIWGDNETDIPFTTSNLKFAFESCLIY